MERVSLRLDTRPPYDVQDNLRWLEGRLVPGIESIEGSRYERPVRMGALEGWLEVEVDGQGALLQASSALRPVADPLVLRVRRLLDLDARPEEVQKRLGQDPLIGESVRRRPGLRVPGAFDPYELAIRAILGQQVSVKSARTLAGRLVDELGTPAQSLRLFPSPEALAETSLERLRKLGLPQRRAETIRGLARAVADGVVPLHTSNDPERIMAAMVELPGIGPWTASYVAMRGLGWSDAFPAEDLMVKRALGVRTAREAEARAEAWRPWRAYGVLHLWTR